MTDTTLLLRAPETAALDSVQLPASLAIINDPAPARLPQPAGDIKPGRVGIVGYGNTAHALACLLNSQGHTVSLLMRDISRGQRLIADKTIKATGKLEGTFTVDVVTDDEAAFCAAADTIFFATTADCYDELAANLASSLTDKHEIVLFSSKLGAAALVEKVLADNGVVDVPVIETDALFDTRTQPDDSVFVRGFKGWTLCSGATRSKTLAYKHIIDRYFVGIDAADNLVQRGLTDFGAVAHATISIANISNIDQARKFRFYYDGLSARTIVLLETVEAEYRSVAEAYGTNLIPMKELLNRYYGCDTTSLLSAMTTVPNYALSVGPETFDHRFLREDIACTLIPAQALARVAGIPTPTLDAIIHFCGLLTGIDFIETGRTLDKLGLAGMTQEEILATVNS